MGGLDVSAPSTFPINRSQSSDRYRASTTIRGSVSRSNYDTVIQRAGRLPGVRLQGMTSLASAQGQTDLEERLLKRALDRGQSQAASPASALGLSQVKLLRIDQRSHPAPRELAMAATAAPRFRPGEAPLPTRTLMLTLDYLASHNPHPAGLGGDPSSVSLQFFRHLDLNASTDPGMNLQVSDLPYRRC